MVNATKLLQLLLLYFTAATATAAITIAIDTAIAILTAITIAILTAIIIAIDTAIAITTATILQLPLLTWRIVVAPIALLMVETKAISMFSEAVHQYVTISL